MQETKIPNQILFRGAEGRHQGDNGENAQKKQEAVRGREDNFYTTTSPSLELNYKHYPTNVLFNKQAAYNDADKGEIYSNQNPTTGLLNKHAAKDKVNDRELSEDIKNDADIISVDTNTQDAANKVIINDKMTESYIPGTIHHKMKKKVHVSHKKQGKNKKKGGGLKK